MFDNEETFFERTDLKTFEANFESIFEGLNPQQVEAVKTLEGPLLIMAGAGSGKTKVLTCRMANLLAHDISPTNILAITFTNKAANEMKSRAEKMIGSSAKKVWISTFHSFCARLLRNEIEVAGKYKKNFVIYTTSESKTVIKDCIKELGLDEKNFLNSAINRISKAKNELTDAKGYHDFIFKKFTKSDFDIHAAEIYELYEKKLLKYNALDFDDLLFVTVKILRDFPEVREKYQDQFKYILIDEYQDTNLAQYMLTKYLAAKNKNICVVGDADQSIYGWRGADMRNILNFEDDYPNAKVIMLEQNYRSTKQILSVANAVIKKNFNRKPKNLWTKKVGGENVKYIRCISDNTEAAFVVREIKKLVAQENFQYKDFAILYRTNAQSRAFEEKLMNNEIPYVVIGGFKFYDRKEIKDIAAYLQVIENPGDYINLQRIINVPRRGIGSTYVQRINQYAAENDLTFFEVISNDKFLSGVDKLPQKIQQTLHNFSAMIISFQESKKNLPLDELINSVIEESGYKKSLTEVEVDDEDKSEKVENQTRVENLSSFVNSAKDFSEMNPDATLEDFLSNVALMSDIDELSEEEESKVSMMTIHSAKGLEFPVVFVTGMDEGILPHSNSSMEMEELEEERRACYVALTRAEKKLYLTSACERKLFGKTYNATVSRFVKEISDGSNFIENFSERKKNNSNLSTAQIYGSNPQNYPHKKIYNPPTAHREAKITLASGKPKEKISWQVGDQAKHRKWGLGTVMEVDGESIKIVFANPEIGEKTLKSAIAPIEKI